MNQPWIRFSVRRLMIVVAVMGLVFASYIKIARELQYSTMLYGWNTSVLPLRRPIRIVEDISFDGSTIPAGTTGIVTYDPPNDYNAFPDRLVGVRLLEGPGAGTVVEVKRTSLRAR